MTISSALAGVVFDAYGTLFDVYGVQAELEARFPGKARAIAEKWREKQIEYSRLRTMSGRYVDFWQITGDALDYACEFSGRRWRQAHGHRCSRSMSACRPIPKFPPPCARSWGEG